MRKTILIASNSRDASTDTVTKYLRSFGHKVVNFMSDKVVDGSAQFQISIPSSSPGPVISYNGQNLDLTNIDASWYRKPHYFTGELTDKGFQLSVAPEYRALQQALWDLIPGQKWLNSPDNIRYAGTKITQLAAAKELGFSVPDTIAGNRWSDIQTLPTDEIIFKPSLGTVYQENNFKGLFANVMRKSDELPLDRNPYPGLWQTRLQKRREWRITVVGEEIFDVAIYTKAEAKDDWRRLQGTSAVTFKKGSFPDSEKKKCLAYLKKYGLRYGAFDFIESDDGKITFLECNPNGQYGWLEEELGLPISKAIADLLIQIAKN